MRFVSELSFANGQAGVLKKHQMLNRRKSTKSGDHTIEEVAEMVEALRNK